MTTIDNIMKLAYKLRDARSSDWDVDGAVEADRALRTALTEALDHIVSVNDMVAQPVRDPLSIRWPHRVEHISELGYVVWRDVFEGVMRCTLRDAVLAHKVAVFVSQDEADDYAHYRNTRTATLGTDAIEPVKNGIGGDK